MELKGKKVIIVGERDGVQGPTIEECIRSAGAEPIITQTQCFVWTSAGAFDLEGQEAIKNIAEEYDREELVVIIGAPDADSAELYAETLVNGDPSWSGPLAGVALKLPVFHIMEPEIKAQIEPSVFKENLELLEIALDVEKITEGLNRVRQLKPGAWPIWCGVVMNSKNTWHWFWMRIYERVKVGLLTLSFIA